MFATLSFSNLDWLWPAAGAAGVAVLVLAWSYRAGPGGWLSWGCAALKALGIAALAFCLLEPLWSGQRARPGANWFAVLADNSQGLQLKDAGENRTRGDALHALLADEGGDWRTTLEENFQVRQFFFDAQLHATRDFREMTFAGTASALGSAVRGVRERFTGRPLAGVLVLTDGNATDWRDVPPELAGGPPVYPVVLGKPGAIRDAALGQVNVSQTAFEDAPVSIQADVAAAGLRGETIVAQLLDQAGRRLQEQSLRVRQNDERLAFRFQFRPEQPGLTFYQLRTGLREEIELSSPAPASPEATLLNNRRVLAVDRGRGPYRILYVAGRPNWEYKFLNRALQEDHQVQLVGLVRVALREPKFDFRGRAGETGNPLFRGFDDQSREAVARYDQPVLVRLGTRDEVELRSGFPRATEELYAYHAVILDDVEAAFFAPDQATLVQKFVAERGGGFLMLGGMESFQQGQYQRTPIGDLLPVYLDRSETGQPAGGLRLELSREGWLQAWARLRDTETAEAARLRDIPPFQVLNPVREIKPGASVVATAKDEQGTAFPALVVQRFGRGRAAAVLLGDLWRWGMRDPAARQDMERSWRQWVRWLVADVPQRVELAVERPSAAANDAVQLEVRVRDEKFQPLDDAAVLIEVQSVLSDTAGTDTNVMRLRAEPSLNEAGVFQATYVPRLTGGYRATACVTNAAGAELGRAEAGWNTDLAAEEFRSLQPNVALLEKIAQRTGGQMVPARKLAEFVRQLPQQQAPVMEAFTAPAWHTPALFAFALACLVAEWGLRRWNGMP